MACFIQVVLGRGWGRNVDKVDRLEDRVNMKLIRSKNVDSWANEFYVLCCKESCSHFSKLLRLMIEVICFKGFNKSMNFIYYIATF